MALQRIHSYELTFATLAAAGGSDSKSFQVETLYDFWWFKASAFVYDSNSLGVSTLQWPLIDVLLQDGSTQQNVTNQATAVNNLFGTGQLPYILPQPHIIVGASNLNATVTNRHAATAYSIRLCFTGVHVPRGSRPAPSMRRRLRV